MTTPELINSALRELQNQYWFHKLNKLDQAGLQQFIIRTIREAKES